MIYNYNIIPYKKAIPLLKQGDFCYFMEFSPKLKGSRSPKVKAL